MLPRHTGGIFKMIVLPEKDSHVIICTHISSSRIGLLCIFHNPCPQTNSFCRSKQMWTPEAAVPSPVKEKLVALEKLGPNAPTNAYLLAFLEIVSQSKHTDRTGWVDRQLPKPESIADHMYRMAVICFMTDNKSLDVGKCQQIALCHDMAEALVGDITPYDKTCNKEEKHRRELATMEYLRNLISKFHPRAAQQIYDLWCEYEFQTTDEAKFVKDVDKFELVSQCSEYTRAYPNVDIADILGASRSIKTDEVKGWANQIEFYDKCDQHQSK